MYISLANSLDHCTQGGTGDGGDTPPSLGRCSVVDSTDVSSVSTASAELSDSGGEAVAVLEVTHEGRELSALHSVSAGIELVTHAGEGVGDAIEFACEAASLLFKSTVSIHFGGGSRVVEAANFFDERVITPVLGGEEGEEPGSCGLRGVLSIVRAEEELDNVGGFPWLPPCQLFHSPIPDWSDPHWDNHLASSSARYSGDDSSLVTFKAIGNTEEAQSSSQLPVVGVALVIESFELDDMEPRFGQALGVVFSPLADGGGEPEGGGADSGVESWIEGEDCFRQGRRDRRVVLACDVGMEAEGDGAFCWRRRDLREGWTGGRFWG